MGNVDRLVESIDCEDDRVLIWLSIGLHSVRWAAQLDRKHSANRWACWSHCFRSTAGAYRPEVVTTPECVVFRHVVHYLNIHQWHCVNIHRKVPTRLWMWSRDGDFANVHWRNCVSWLQVTHSSFNCEMKLILTLFTKRNPVELHSDWFSHWDSVRLHHRPICFLRCLPVDVSSHTGDFHPHLPVHPWYATLFRNERWSASCDSIAGIFEAKGLRWSWRRAWWDWNICCWVNES